MRRRQLRFGAFVVILVAACRNPAREIESSLAAAVAGGVGTFVDMQQAVPCEWDRVYVFTPYTTPEQVEGALGFRWRGAARTGFEYSDAINLLVFTAGEKVVASVEFPRYKGDFYQPSQGGGYARDSAQFVVTHVGQLTSGAPHLVLVPRAYPPA